MSIICALHDSQENCVWLGGNDRATIGDTPTPGPESKWLKLGNWALGMTGNECVHRQYLTLNQKEFPYTSANVLDIFDFLRTSYSDYDLGQKKGESSTTSYGVEGLIVHGDGRIWDFDSRLALTEIPSGKLWGGGSGIDFALGADFMNQQGAMSPKDRVTMAVNCAIALDVYCPGEALIENLSCECTL